MIAHVVLGIEVPIQDAAVAALRGDFLGHHAIVIAEGTMKMTSVVLLFLLLFLLLLLILGLRAPLDQYRSLASLTGSISPTTTVKPLTVGSSRRGGRLRLGTLMQFIKSLELSYGRTWLRE